LNQDDFHRLISGRTRGPGAAIGRFCLCGLGKGYGAAIAIRNLAYSQGIVKSHKVDAAVFSIGNITAGGTGKTPLVMWLYNYITQNSKLKTQNCRCAILTRGYKSIQNSKLKTQNYSDEPAILEQGCPEAEVIVKADRLAGAVEAVEKYNARAVILDDGFQHRRLARDIDIVTIDATRPFGYRKLLPAGLLREPVTALRRADVIVITRCDQVSENKLNDLEEKLRKISPDVLIARSVHWPVSAKCEDGTEIGIGQLKGRKIFAFCGIGNPQAFFKTVEGLGSELVGSKIYNDHHHYCDNDKTEILEQAAQLGADLILTTQKDRTKIGPETVPKKNIPLAYLAIELKFTAGEDKLKQLIEETLAGKIPAR